MQGLGSNSLGSICVRCFAQTVSERLSQHVLDNYSNIVSGVNEVASVERDLQVRAWRTREPERAAPPPVSAAVGRPEMMHNRAGRAWEW